MDHARLHVLLEGGEPRNECRARVRACRGREIRHGHDTVAGATRRGDVYRTLLREATTSLLNSYNSLGFFYPTLSVIELTNLALLGSPQQALMTALRFRRANAGVAGRGTNATCNFTPCS
uniref:Uncharacterized protein n=1 Tax=Ananas comosus var. bracteatus TaxID=296719 RepID=A0A6V7QN66_ANACO|nr:unnamed protein product [Ananas comosus var. bracteatus]